MTAVTSPVMPAAVYVGDGRIEVLEVPVPEPRSGEVLIEVAECGICGSDLHLVLDRYAKPGAILGHEWSGTVAHGAAPELSFRPGTRVVWNPSSGCGTCRACRRGRPSVCTERAAVDYLDARGAYCRYLTVPATNLVTIPDSLPTRVAALAEPTAIALHAITLADVTPSDRVLVTGAGPVGLLIIAVLRAQGVEDITVSEPSALRRERALDVGAARAVLPTALPEAPTGSTVRSPYGVAFECSGTASAAEAALDQLDKAGTLIFVGTGAQLPRLNHNRMIILELEAVGAYNYNIEGFLPALDLLADGRLPLHLLVEPHDIALSGVMEAMERLARGEIPSKVLVRPEVG
jgi:2-desacetyl-2-hydroxyethyl bacteriochlorophyllide A dehydrogenase